MVLKGEKNKLTPLNSTQLHSSLLPQSYVFIPSNNNLGNYVTKGSVVGERISLRAGRVNRGESWSPGATHIIACPWFMRATRFTDSFSW